MSEETVLFAVSVEGDAWNTFTKLVRLSNMCDLHLYTLGVESGYAYIEGSYTDDEREEIEKFCEDSGIRIDNTDEEDTQCPFFFIIEPNEDEEEDE